MPTVVLNTSALSVFKETNSFDLLRNLFSEENILIPSGVLKEFNKKYRDKPSFVKEKELNKIQKRKAEAINLGRGEREAIILSEDLDAIVVMDERKGRKECKKRGVECIGIIGIIREAYVDCLLNEEERRELVEKLKIIDFYSEDRLFKWILNAEKSDKN